MLKYILYFTSYFVFSTVNLLTAMLDELLVFTALVQLTSKTAHTGLVKTACQMQTDVSVCVLYKQIAGACHTEVDQLMCQLSCCYYSNEKCIASVEVQIILSIFFFLKTHTTCGFKVFLLFQEVKHIVCKKM